MASGLYRVKSLIGLLHELIDMSATVALDRLAAWKIALRAENKSPGTVTIYADCVSRYVR